jgi:hypothetical protein
MQITAILDAAAPVSPGRHRTDTISTDPAVRRRYRSIYNEVERAGSIDVAQTVASLAIHLEQHRQTRLERHELVAMCAVLSLVDRHTAERPRGSRASWRQ